MVSEGVGANVKPFKSHLVVRLTFSGCPVDVHSPVLVSAAAHFTIVLENERNRKGQNVDYFLASPVADTLL